MDSCSDTEGGTFSMDLRLTRIILQIGFLTEWQLYAQKLEGDSWVGEKIDKSKLDKLSGKGGWNSGVAHERTMG